MTILYDDLPEFLKDGFTVEAAIRAFELSEITEDQVMVAAIHHRREGNLNQRAVLMLVSAGALTDKQGGRVLAIGAPQGGEPTMTLRLSRKGVVAVSGLPGMIRGIWFTLQAARALFSDTAQAREHRCQIIAFCNKNEEEMLRLRDLRLSELRATREADRFDFNAKET
jgi:hypothetical protein